MNAPVPSISFPIRANTLRNASDAPDASPWSLTDNRHLALLLQRSQRLCKFIPFHLSASLLIHLFEHFRVPRRPSLPSHLVQQARDGILEVLFSPSLARAGPFRQETHVDQARPRVRRGLLESGLDQPDRLRDVVYGDFLGQAHLGMSLGESDHGLQLPRRGRDAPLGGADIFAELAHLHV